MTGLRFFLSNGHNLELLKSKYPDTIEPLSGFITMIHYLRGELTVEGLRKLATTLHRLNLGHARGDNGREHCTLYLGPSSETFRFEDNCYTLSQVEHKVTYKLINRIWYEAFERQRNNNIYNEETVYQILSDNNVNAWRGSQWHELLDLEHTTRFYNSRRIALTKDHIKLALLWNVDIHPFRVMLRKDHIVTFSIYAY